MRFSIPLLGLGLACASKPVEAPLTPPVGPEPVVFVEVPPEQARPAPTQPNAAVPSAGPSEADRAMAKQLFVEGLAAYEAGDVATARGYFEQAYALAPLPALLFNIARCHEQLGDLAAACETYERIGSDVQTDEHTRESAAERVAALGC